MGLVLPNNLQRHVRQSITDHVRGVQAAVKLSRVVKLEEGFILTKDGRK